MIFYEIGAVRWRRYTGKGDVRLYRPAKGWGSFAYSMESHPITCKAFTQAEWWLREEFVG